MLDEYDAHTLQSVHSTYLSFEQQMHDAHAVRLSSILFFCLIALNNGPLADFKSH